MVRAPSITAQNIASYFLTKYGRTKGGISNKKLQKLLYYSQAWSLALFNKKLFSEKIEAWVHGPAIRSIYVEYKHFGFQPIDSRSDDSSDTLPCSTQSFLDDVWRVYGKYDSAYLEELTHSEEPWQKARTGLEIDEGSTNEILTNDMRAYYLAKLKASKAKK